VLSRCGSIPLYLGRMYRWGPLPTMAGTTGRWERGDGSPRTGKAPPAPRTPDRPRTRPARTGPRGSERGTSRPKTPNAPRSLVELKVRAPAPTHWLQDLGSRWGATVQVHVCRPLGKHADHLLRLMEIMARPDQIEEITRFLIDNGGRGNVAVTALAPHRILVRLVTSTPALCNTVFDMGAICTSCPYLPPSASSKEEGSEFVWGLLSPSASSMRPLIESYRTPGSPPPELLRIGEFHAARELTARQEFALEVAVKMGYFETPRRSGLPEVAKALGVSRATAMEVLRRALQKLTEQWKEGPPFLLGDTSR
jgi:hypothetical protein